MNGAIELQFFENAAGESVTVSGDEHRRIINEFFCPELINIYLNGHLISIGWQYTSVCKMDLLSQFFEQIIYSNGESI